MECRVDGDTLRVSGRCHFSDNNRSGDFLLLSQTAKIDSFGAGAYRQNGDTITFSGSPAQISFAYALPLKDYRTTDGAIVLRREGNWYPHRNGELLAVNVHVETTDCYVIGGSEAEPSFDMHLVLLPKDKYTRTGIDNAPRPFHFYRAASDTTHYPDAYYSEYTESYNFYCSYFGDTLSPKPMNVVEIGDPQFVMCQSLRDMIILGHYFYQIYTMIPDFSWIPHEVAHQWWGNNIFFEHRDYALSESLTEYIKLQFLKSRGRGYNEQTNYFLAMIERAERQLPIATINSVESQDESIAIYHAVPYRLEQLNVARVNAALQRLYNTHKHTVVHRDTFLKECGIMKTWLQSK